MSYKKITNPAPEWMSELNYRQAIIMDDEGFDEWSKHHISVDVKDFCAIAQASLGCASEIIDNLLRLVDMLMEPEKCQKRK